VFGLIPSRGGAPMNQRRTLVLSVFLASLPGLAGCSRPPSDGPRALDGLSQVNPARAEPKGAPGPPSAKATDKPRADREGEDLRRTLPKVKMDRERAATMVNNEPSFSVTNNWGDNPQIQRAILWQLAPKPGKQPDSVIYRATVGGATWTTRMNEFPQ